jgi:hypothetical protein
MEFAFNAFWGLVALASFWLWRPQAARAWGRCQHHYGPIFRVATLACALVVLFPVISLTDDLHGEQPLAEDSSAPLRILKRWTGDAGSSNSQKFSSPPAAFLWRELALRGGPSLGWAAAVHLAPASPRLANSSGSRAPPSRS